MLTIDAIADAIRASRSEFGNLFLQAQAGAPLASRTIFESIGLAGDDKTAFAAALRFAWANGWLASLVDAIIDGGLEDGRLAESVLKEGLSLSGDAALQAITNLEAGFATPHVLYRGYADGMRWTGKVVVNSVPTGTCILVGPNLVLTAWHVVKTLFEPDGAAIWRARDRADFTLEVVFDDFLASVGRSSVLRPVGEVRVKAHDRWCVDFSACHEAELQDQLPADLASLEAHWDYALMRLETPIGQERRWATIDSRAAVPRAMGPIVLFQHAGMQPLKVANDFIADTTPAERQSLPRLRFLHRANSAGGSSGGPCFDKAFTLFGLHQGTWTRTEDGRGTLNRGIPIQRIHESIKRSYEALPEPDLTDTRIWHLGGAGNYSPVIGCSDFQALVWSATLRGRPRMILVRGEQGRGKSFQADVVGAMLPAGGHLKVVLEASQIGKLTGDRIAAAICNGAGFPTPEFAKTATTSSTDSVWLRDEVVRRLVDALASGRNGRMVWIVIKDLNNHAIDGEGASDMLLLLYEQLVEQDWLRIVLDGMRGDLPERLADMTRVHRVKEPTAEEIKSYLNRLCADLNLPVDAYGILAGTRMLAKRYEDAMIDDPATAMRILVDHVRRLAEGYIAAAAP